MTEDYSSSPADEIVDDLMPVDLDWRRLVRSYPIPAVTVATVGGFLIGRRRGLEMLSALADFVTREVSSNVQSLLGGAAAAGNQPDPDTE